ncbi:hypothetical protein GCM10010347_63770 [Streptomyces cirratus]|uniref:Secreted protein n=1 Tax=Streptomyces cirratus TaxID=68187 RepID=A0ABQ3F3N4_9ACTN|nr:hypothetical protein [Streptomyces cirratus]GHB84081.1 hypothetical protein GCM10010347_63770 [Streptomyces cirratus]
MRLKRKCAVIGATVASAVIMCAGGASAQESDGLLGAVANVLNGPALFNICQTAHGNATCDQRASQTSSSTSPAPTQRVVVTENGQVPPGSALGPIVQCPTGTEPVSGGADPSNDQVSRISRSHPSGNGWFTVVANEGQFPIDVTYYAICETSA